jgi:hypothetical protein
MKAKHVFTALFLAITLSAAFAVDIDGKIAAGEYSNAATLKTGVFTLLWEISGDKIFMAIEAVSAGWISIGFDPINVMAKSDMIFAMVGQGADVKVVDAWSTGTFGPHPADKDQGGKDDILAFAGSRNGDKVVIEFSRLLDTKDKYDKIIPAAGSVKVIWATGSSMAFNSMHHQAGSGTITTGRAK